MILTALEHKNAHNFAALCCTIFFELYHVPHMVLHLVVYILLHNSKMVDRNLQWTEVFLKNRHVSFTEPYRLTFTQQGKSFHMHL